MAIILAIYKLLYILIKRKERRGSVGFFKLKIIHCKGCWKPHKIVNESSGTQPNKMADESSDSQAHKMADESSGVAEYMLKIVVVGNSGVGKTAFMLSYSDNSFSPAFVSTVGIDFRVKTIIK